LFSTLGNHILFPQGSLPFCYLFFVSAREEKLNTQNRKCNIFFSSFISAAVEKKQTKNTLFTASKNCGGKQGVEKF